MEMCSGVTTRFKGRDVRLIESSVLIEYLMKSHGLAPRASVASILDASGRTYLSLELAYYQRKVYWVTSYDDGRFTVLDATGSYPDTPTLELLKPMIKAELEAGDFIDLREEAKILRARAIAEEACCRLCNPR
jgi:hypothetical protein